MNISEKDFLNKIDQHKGILLKVSRIYCDHPDDRKDLFQEIILQMWKSIAQFKGNSQFSTWMYRVAINTALIFHKKEKRRPDNISLGTEDTQATEPYDGKHEKQLKQFYLATQQLNEIEKALILMYIEGYSSEQISKVLGINPTNARVKTNRTKTKLKNIIEATKDEL